MKRTELPYILALDHGTSGCKTAVVSSKGTIIDSEFIATRMRFSPDGGAKSSLWCQIFADVMDRVIIQMKDPMHANAHGAA